MVEDADSLGQDGDRLDGWKEIAAYLRKDVRTAIRWSKHEAMPVYRHAEGKRGAIYAYRSEIDAWIHADRSVSPGPTNARWYRTRGAVTIGIGSALALVLAMSLLWWNRSHEASDSHLGERPAVLIADFDNRTGETRFDGTLETAFRRELANSRHVSVIAPQRIVNTLAKMQRSLDVAIDTNLGREICLRHGGICAVLAGRVESFGSSYLLSLELVDPTDGRTVASAEELADRDDEVLPAVHRLGDWLRTHLGEEMTQLSSDGLPLEAVTTPSLRALELYSKGRQLGITTSEGEALFRQAVEEDPGFASAHVYLFWSLHHQGKGLDEEARGFLARAMELADSASEEERLFIEGTYFDFYDGDQERSCTSYKALAELFPDHFFAAGNAAHVCGSRLGYRKDLVRYSVQAEELRAPEFSPSAAAALALVAGNFDRARPLVEDLRKVGADGEDLPALASQSGPWSVAFTELFSAEESLDKGLLEDVEIELKRVNRLMGSMEPTLQRWLAWKLQSFYLALGQFDRARALHGEILDPLVSDIWIAYLADDEETLEKRLADYRARLQMRRPDPLERLVFLLGWNMGWATEGTLSHMPPLDVLVPEDASVSISRGETSDGRPFPMFLSLPRGDAKMNLVLGKLRLDEGHTDEGIRLLERGVDWFREYGDWTTFPYYFLGAELLAVALDQRGNPTAALSVLADAGRQKSMVYSSSMPLYQRIQARRARLSRELGRPTEAEAIEVELVEALRFADQDHPILRQIRQQRAGLLTSD